MIASAQPKTMLEISHLWKAFPTPKGGEITIVKDFSLKLAEGEFATLIGHSGCGKSTVLSIVAGLANSTKGGIILAGRETDEPGPDRGVVFQAPCLLPWLTAFENVMIGVNQVYFTASKHERKQVAEYYLSVVGLGEAMHKYPAELSQGMRQRVGIARAFALQPKMLLLDEPFGMLDALTRFELQQVLLELWRKFRITTLMVTHDVDEAIFLSDRVVMMSDGPEAEVGDILRIPFERPRDRKVIMEDPRYYDLREHLITFLNDRSHLRPSKDPEFKPSPDMAEELRAHRLPVPTPLPAA
ncbi:nitrate/nitrite transport system ATP-binding protein [Roseimicrobium gellanilyticum]|uniref:Nitrate/nitrite transport system ATP-binding protein n=1 Tax=Roseimicrobium gellanilyticum TaxID=748857 RepID=A0A366HTN6_9BACT|nr:ABC transporter ATP-binding protein [Roseimicrobium gellanilyticum]RBP47642.1 nitrate/nitrite transport system ATP-binding protein [Roseimicrobium gellanilyticum]